MAGNATLTMVPSRNTTPDPSTDVHSTHRAAGVPQRMVPAAIERRLRANAANDPLLVGLKRRAGSLC